MNLCTVSQKAKLFSQKVDVSSFESNLIQRFTFSLIFISFIDQFVLLTIFTINVIQISFFCLTLVDLTHQYQKHL